MGIEYNLANQEPSKGIASLREELAPRNQCERYVIKQGGLATLIPKQDFDEKAIKNEFTDGPFIDTFGNGNEPYNPNRQAFGKLNSGLVVYCELSNEYKKKSDELMGLEEKSE